MKSKTSKMQKQGKASVQKKSKTVTKRATAKKSVPKWKVVGGKVLFEPGDYTLADIKAALMALENTK